MLTLVDGLPWFDYKDWPAQFEGIITQRKKGSGRGPKIGTREFRSSQIKCAGCLRMVGYGLKAISKRTGLPLTTIRRMSPVPLPHRHRTSSYNRRAELTHRAKSGMARKKPITNQYLAEVLRCRVRNALKGNGIRKHESTVALLGCSISHLREHLTSQFYDGMTWQNYGHYWHIDHILPCASFDLSRADEQLRCFHYSNLQPLEAVENIKKHANWPNRISRQIELFPKLGTLYHAV